MEPDDRMGVHAMMYALLGSGLGALAAVMTLALLLYKAQRETMHAGDLLNAERSLSRQYQGERDVEVAAHAVTSAQLKAEQQLRAVAEAQRNEAQRRARDELAKHMRTASNEEIQAVVDQLFAGPLGVSPPAAAPNRTGADALIDPFTDV